MFGEFLVGSLVGGLLWDYLKDAYEGWDDLNESEKEAKAAELQAQIYEEAVKIMKNNLDEDEKPTLTAEECIERAAYYILNGPI